MFLLAHSSNPREQGLCAGAEQHPLRWLRREKQTGYKVSCLLLLPVLNTDSQSHHRYPEHVFLLNECPLETLSEHTGTDAPLISVLLNIIKLTIKISHNVITFTCI